MGNTFKAAINLMDRTTGALDKPAPLTEGEKRAAHLFRCYEGWRASEICTEEGISDDEQERGAKVARLKISIENRASALFGSPEYGMSLGRSQWIKDEMARQGVVE